MNSSALKNLHEVKINTTQIEYNTSTLTERINILVLSTTVYFYSELLDAETMNGS